MIEKNIKYERFYLEISNLELWCINVRPTTPIF